MKGDAKVIEYLNSALCTEFTAVSQYWVHSRMQDDWGLIKMTRKSRAESIEEMEHVNRLIDRILFLEGRPNLQNLASPRIGEGPRETLECDLAGEHDALTLYREACDYCASVHDYVSKNLFEDLIADEEGHVDFLETQLDLHDRIGAERYAQLNAATIDEAE